jgi:5-methylcytosine-specific restriction endonuclease McrA
VVREVYEFDHVVPLWKGGLDHELNIQGLCKEHHDIKTAAEAAERARTGRPPLPPQSSPLGFA